jgi:hypothetical protein
VSYGYLPDQPTGPRRSISGQALAIAGAVVLAMLIATGAVLWTINHPLRPQYGVAVARSAGTQAQCSEQPPASASAPARAYVAAVDALLPRRIELHRTLQAAHGWLHHNDLGAEADIDTEFLRRLTAIRFTGVAVQPAASLESTLRQYIGLLRTSYDHNGYLAAHPTLHHQLNNDRSLAAAALRDALGLPPSPCVLLRP